jgi:acyl-CoA synthetase (AMP-forming)/AMP-acid ligase II
MDHPNPCFRTIADVLQYRASQNPDAVAYIFLDFPGNDRIVEHQITYAELDERSRRLGSCLRGSIARGERAVMLYPPGIDYIVAFFACQYAGIIAVPSYPPFSQRTLAQFVSVMQDADPKRILSTKIVADGVKSLISGERQQQICPEWMWMYTDDLETVGGDPAVTTYDISFLQYTSGSTSKPKGVMLTHGNLLHNLSLIHQCFGHHAGSRGVIWLPPYHDMGLIGGILQPLYAGFPVYLFSPLSFLKKPLRWLQAISRYRATTSGGPNFAYELCIRKITPDQRKDLDLSSWDLAFNGAEPIQPSTLDRFSESFRECGFDARAFYPCYGLAESTLIVSGGRKASPPFIKMFDMDALRGNTIRETGGEDIRKKTYVGCGSSLARGEIIIVDPETRIKCDPDRIGEIWVKGPSVAAGYWNNSAETEEAFHAHLQDTNEGPYLRTGDLGFLHQGELFVTGRIKDMIIHRGMNIYPHDIERTAEQSHPCLRRGCNAAFSVDDRRENRIVLLQEVTFDPGGAEDGKIHEIVSSIRTAVAVNHGIQVSDIALVKNNTLLKTSSGKIQRNACRTAYLSGALDPLFSTHKTRPADKKKSEHHIT